MNKTIKTQVSTVTCIQASRCKNTGKEIFTLELEYPRVIHAQLLTHGVFSKNSSSTRAVPLKAAIQQIKDSPAKYIWTDNKSGMQGEVSSSDKVDMYESLFSDARYEAIRAATLLSDAGAHKQNAGRLLEPFQNIKIVLTSTEWENWDWLRDHEDAQGEIADLARAMKEARDTADIMDIGEGEWHVPYVDRERGADTGDLYYLVEGGQITAEEAKSVSVSVCAQVSYRKADTGLEKAVKMEGMLVDGHKVHASPFEHIATPMPFISQNMSPMRWPKGVTHMRRDGSFGSGNFVNWIQLRQLVERHDKALF